MIVIMIIIIVIVIVIVVIMISCQKGPLPGLHGRARLAGLRLLAYLRGLRKGKNGLDSINIGFGNRDFRVT